MTRARSWSALLAIAITGVVLSAQTPVRTFVGTIGDSECPRGDHSTMKMGDTNAECARACVESHGASLLLVEGDQEYELSDQAKALPFAGQVVTVRGTLDKRRIIVESIGPAERRP